MGARDAHFEAERCLNADACKQKRHSDSVVSEGAERRWMAQAITGGERGDRRRGGRFDATWRWRNKIYGTN